MTAKFNFRFYGPLILRFHGLIFQFWDCLWPAGAGSRQEHRLQKAEFIICSVLPRSTGFLGEAFSALLGWPVAVEGREQQQLNGQSRERDPGLPTPALSFWTYSNRHQGVELPAQAELAACRREGH